MLVYQRVYHHISSHKIFTIEYDIMESWTSYGKTRWLKSSCNGSNVPFTSRGCWRRDVQPCCWFWKILGLQLQVSKRNLSGWWFQTFGKIFHFIYGMSSFPLTNSYFSEGLKPPTRYRNLARGPFFCCGYLAKLAIAGPGAFGLCQLVWPNVT